MMENLKVCHVNFVACTLSNDDMVIVINVSRISIRIVGISRFVEARPNFEMLKCLDSEPWSGLSVKFTVGNSFGSA